MVTGSLLFNEQEGHFCIADEENEEILGDIQFGDNFQVLIDGVWIDTALEIGNNDMGELVFKLRNTKLEHLQGLTVRM